jgi:xanthine dehydrogenase accessory factor
MDNNGMVTDDEVLAAALAWRAAGRRVALATVAATWGSSPRPVGSRMAVDETGAMAGSVTSGCVENAVVLEAKAAMADGKPRLLTYGVTEEKAWEVGLTCGGTVRVLVTPVNDPSPLARLAAAVKARRAAALVVHMTTGAEAVVGDGSAAAGLPEAVAREAAERLEADRSGIAEAGEGAYFVRVHAPPRRLFVIGAVHIAQALVPMARMAGYDVTVIDPRAAFATGARFPGVPLLTTWPADAFESLGLDAHTAVVSLSHDPKIDDPALEAALRSPAFYVGALGSKANQAKRRLRLGERGLDEDRVARLHGPVGLAIGALTPAEIAVSILAEITAVRRGKAV